MEGQCLFSWPTLALTSQARGMQARRGNRLPLRMLTALAFVTMLPRSTPRLFAIHARKRIQPSTPARVGTTERYGMPWLQRVARAQVLEVAS